MILFDRILRQAENSIATSILITYQTRTKLQFANGSEIVALPCGREGNTLRGFTCDMVILDECNFIPRTVIESVVTPMMITRRNAKLIMISTPWVRDHPFYEAISKPELGFKTYTWPSSMNPLITPKKLEQERKAMGEYEFNREYNAAFIDDEFSYLPSNLVLSCTDSYELRSEPAREEKLKGEYLIGIDFGKHTDHSAIAILEKENDHLRLVYLNELPLETPYTAVIGQVRNLNEAYAFMAGCLDKTGVGEGPYEEIRQFIRGIDGITLTAQMKQDILGKLKLVFEQHKLTLPRDNQRLLVQITGQLCEPTKSGTLAFSHPARMHDDQLWALALAAYANRETPPSARIRPITKSFG